jgi:hydroxyacylglutathione hydrolase
MVTETAQLRMRTLAVGPLWCTCGIVACPETGEAAIVDPGGDADAILAEVAAMGVTVKLVLHTHGHFDHIMGTEEIVAATHAEVLLHRDDRELYENLPAQALVILGVHAGQPPAVTRWLAGGETLAIGRMSAVVIHTPGHTPGCVGYYFSAPSPLLLAGDTLMAEGVGRTDLPGGSRGQLERSIRERLYVLPTETRVISGHGPETTIGHEREHNPEVPA